MAQVSAGMIAGKGLVGLVSFDEPPPGPGCVGVDISLCGICGTDVGAFRHGHPLNPAVCGHEWVGTVAEIGAGVTAVHEGDRVVVAVPPPCGACGPCSAGHGDFCRTVTRIAHGRDPLAPLHGGFAPRITVAAARVLPAHAALTDEEAAQVEPAAVALRGVRRARVRPGDAVVVQGAGPIGLLVQQFARAAGAGAVLVLEPSPTRRRLAEELGATVAIAPEDARGVVRDRTGGLGADVVFECAGAPGLVQQGVELSRAGGTVVLLSFLAQPLVIDGARWLGSQVGLVASNAYTAEDCRRAMAFLADGRVRVGPLHTRTVGLEDFASVVAELGSGGSQEVKVLVDPRRPAVAAKR